MIENPNKTKTKHSQEEKKKRFLFSQPWNSYPEFPFTGSTRVIRLLLKLVAEDCVLLLWSRSLRQGGWDCGDRLYTLGAGTVPRAGWLGPGGGTGVWEPARTLPFQAPSSVPMPPIPPHSSRRRRREEQPWAWLSPPAPPRRGRVFVLFTRSGGRVSVGKGEAGNGFYLTFFISVRESLGSSNIH